MMTEPKTVYAGDTWSWTVEDADYADYALTYYLRNAASKIDVAATADGNTYTVSVDAATTAGYTAGLYQWVRRVTGALGTFTRGTGTIEVLANLGVDAVHETRSLARTALDNIDAYLLNENNLAAASYSIGGRSLSRWSRAELRVERDYWLGQVQTEEAEAATAAGRGNPRRLYARFNR